MNKCLLTIALVASAFAAGAQAQVTNNDFENWGTNYPTGWGSPDQAVSSVLGYQGTVIKSTAPYAGAFACTLEPKYNALISQTIPGIVVSGDFGVNMSTFAISFSGTPYTDRPTDMTFYYKFSPAGGDTAGAAVLLTWNDTNTPGTDTVAYGELTINTAAAAYTLGTVNLNYRLTNAPDTILVMFSGTLNQMTIGTSYTVDAATLNGTASSIQENPDLAELMVYPNPANDVVKFSRLIDSELSYVEVYDMNGRKMQTVNMINNITEMSTVGMAQGMYFYSVYNKNGNLVGTGKLSIKH